MMQEATKVRTPKIVWLLPICLFLCSALLLFLFAWDYIRAAATVVQALTVQEQSHAAAQLRNVSLLQAAPVPDVSEETIEEDEEVINASYPFYGDFVGSLDIPSAGIKSDVFQGDDTDTLKLGAGHFFYSGMPGEPEKVVISGHRTTDFRTLGEAAPGDEIIFTTYYGVYRYVMRESVIFEETDEAPVLAVDDNTIFIYTCYPFRYVGHAPKRYAIICDLVEGVPVCWK